MTCQGNQLEAAYCRTSCLLLGHRPRGSHLRLAPAHDGRVSGTHVLLQRLPPVSDKRKDYAPSKTTGSSKHV